MEPGHEDREDVLVLDAPCPALNAPQWSPVTKTGKTAFERLTALEDMEAAMDTAEWLPGRT